MSKLFHPVKIGNLFLSHRVVMAPTTRFRATSAHVPIPLVPEHYSQRSTIPGSLLISEATIIAAKAGGLPLPPPGIWSKEQISVWKEVTSAVHANGSSIFVQLVSGGRAAYPAVLKAEDPTFDHVGPSAIPVRTRPQDVPREMTIAEIEEYIQLFVQAAKNAIFEAGFDGVEIHAANGYIIDQFLQDVSNQRTDNYGGSIEARSRFGLEVVDAVIAAIGPERTGVRLSPFNTFNDMGMADPLPQFAHFVAALKERQPELAYLHVIEPRAAGDQSRVAGDHESNDLLREIWQPRPYISAGGYDRESAIKDADEKGILIAFSRMYTSNPDLPYRLKENIPLTKYDRSRFYVPGDQEDTGIGYIDFPPAHSFQN